jgi:hypothetical protein
MSLRIYAIPDALRLTDSKCESCRDNFETALAAGDTMIWVVTRDNWNAPHAYRDKSDAIAAYDGCQPHDDFESDECHY